MEATDLQQWGEETLLGLYTWVQNQIPKDLDFKSSSITLQVFKSIISQQEKSQIKHIPLM